MRIGLLGDVHANLHAFEAVLADAHARGLERLWNIGDYVGYGPNPQPCVDLSARVCEVNIQGNYDRKVVRFPRKRRKWQHKKKPAKYFAFHWAWEHLDDRARRWLADLPRHVDLDVEGQAVLVCHSGSEDDEEALTSDTPAARWAQLADQARADLVVFGHSHRPVDRRIDGVRFVGTGSVGRPEGGDPRAVYTVLDIQRGSVSAQTVRVEYDVEATCADIARRGLPSAFEEMVRQGRNYDQVIAARPPANPRTDDLETQAESLARRCHYEADHARNVGRLALELFDQLAGLHGLGGRDRQLLAAAALVHDVGWVDGQAGHHKASARIVRADASLPVSDRERAVLCAAIRYHRRALPSPDHLEWASLDRRDRGRARWLAALVRLADGLDRTHRGVVAGLCVQENRDCVEITFSAAGPADEECSAAVKKADLLENALERPVRVRRQ